MIDLLFIRFGDHSQSTLEILDYFQIDNLSGDL